MPEEINETVEETQEEETTVQDSVEARLENEEKNIEEKKGIMQGLREKFFPQEKHEETTEETVEIPSEFLEAAKEAGFTEDQINQLGKDYTAEELKELLPHLMEEEEEEEEKEEEETVEKTELPEGIKDELKPYVEEMKKFFEDKYRESVSELEELKSRLVDQDADKAVHEFQAQRTEADELFDSVSKEFPVFGKTEELPVYPPGHKNEGAVIPVGEAFKARNQVWQMATKFNELGTPWKDSLQEAFAWYKGKYGEKELKNSIVKNLKKNEQRLSPRRTSKETTQTYASEHEEKLAILEAAKRKAGIS